MVDLLIVGLVASCFTVLVCLGDFAVGTFGLCFLFRLLFRVFEFVDSVGFLWFFSIEVFWCIGDLLDCYVFF